MVEYVRYGKSCNACEIYFHNNPDELGTSAQRAHLVKTNEDQTQLEILPFDTEKEIGWWGSDTSCIPRTLVTSQGEGDDVLRDAEDDDMIHEILCTPTRDG